MKIARVEVDGRPQLAVRVGDRLCVTSLSNQRAAIDLTAMVGDPTVRDELEATANGQRRAVGSVAIEDAHLLPPTPRTPKIVAIGLNYIDHAAEASMTLPAEPLVFTKFPSSMVGSGAPIRVDPRLTSQVDYEAELGVIIGTTARDVPVASALSHVFGYTCVNDVSARDLQFGDGQWVRGKSLDTFCPVGPWIVTADEIPDPQALGIRCLVNGEPLQDATTADMIFGVAELVSRLSRWMSLEPGDLIVSGTPPGVGAFRSPPRYLTPGDEVVVEIERIGRLVNPVGEVIVEV